MAPRMVFEDGPRSPTSPRAAYRPRKNSETLKFKDWAKVSKQIEDEDENENETEAGTQQATPEVMKESLESTEYSRLHPTYLQPEAYSPQPPDVRYLVNWLGREGGPPVGWFSATRPFQIQIEKAAPVKTARPIFEVVTDVKGSAKQGHEVVYQFPDSLEGDAKVVSGSHAPPPAETYPPPPGYGPPHSSEIPGHKGTQPPLTLRDIAISVVEPMKLNIYSPLLLQGLKEVVAYYPGQYYDIDVLTVSEPYGILLHHLPEMRQFAQSPSPTKKATAIGSGLTELEHKERARHFQILLDFLSPYIQNKVSVAETKLSCENPRISFDELWYLYKPGTLVYIELYEGLLGPVWYGAIVKQFEYVTKDKTETTPEGSLQLWKLNSTGDVVGRKETLRIIDVFEGDREVRSLSAYPAEIYDAHDKGARRKMLLEQGKDYYKLSRTGNKEMMYNGKAIMGKSEDGKFKEIKYKGRVIIDHATAILHNEVDNEFTPDRIRDNSLVFSGGSGPAPEFPWSSYDDIVVKDTEELTDDQYLLCTPLVAGYSLKDKQWMLLNSTALTEISRDDSAIQNIILDPDDLRVIKALSKRANKDLPWSADFIEGKGGGQIVLLHGPPGVGKTYTVECIAESFGRPLLSLTIADIGTEESNVERELSRWFAMAETWNAVLLIDEADIFLERRRNADLARNGIVSVFLRQMEYFSGLLFITTNRVGQIDDAFISRVHVVIEYSELADETREKIWRAFFKKLQKERPGKIIVGNQAINYVLTSPEVKECNWNGREIRNAFQTAIALAEFEASENDSPVVMVESEHFKRVMTMSKKFQMYLYKIREADEAKRAAARKDR